MVLLKKHFSVSANFEQLRSQIGWILASLGRMNSEIAFFRKSRRNKASCGSHHTPLCSYVFKTPVSRDLKAMIFKLCFLFLVLLFCRQKVLWSWHVIVMLPSWVMSFVESTKPANEAKNNQWYSPTKHQQFMNDVLTKHKWIYERSSQTYQYWIHHV